MKKNTVVAIDGHSSCGKSTYAKMIAKEYHLLYADSGAMYRATTLFAIRHDLILDGRLTESGIEQIMNEVIIDFKQDAETGENFTLLNGEEVEHEIRGIDVSNHVSHVSKIPAIRDKMVTLQQKLGEQKRIVMDGRDIGTVVFPDADIKIFLTASPEIRAKRRFNELVEKGIKVNYEDVLENVKKRDFIDENRDVAPLKKATDAHLLDNSHMTVKEQMKWFADKFESILK
jgi:cytidylate kinase